MAPDQSANQSSITAPPSQNEPPVRKHSELAEREYWKPYMPQCVRMGDTLVYNPDTVMLNHVHKQLVFCVLGKDAVQGNCLEESKHLVFQKLQAWATITCGKLAVEYVRPTEVVHCAVYSRKLGSETFGATSSEDYADIFWGTTASLQGCENDAHNMAEFLMRQHKFKCDVRIGAAATTASAILDALVDLAIDSYDKALDTVWIHYSGHGTSIAGFSDNELDRFDECLVPSNFRLIPDDYIAKVLYYFNPRTSIVFVADCCHSGTISDLPFTWIDLINERSAPRVENKNEHGRG
eukprot:gene25124-biopygen19583